MLIYKIPSPTCVDTHNNTNINTKSSCQKFPVLYVYIYSTATHTYTQWLVAKMPSLTCVYTLYNNPNIKTKAHCQNSLAYICT